MSNLFYSHIKYLIKKGRNIFLFAHNLLADAYRDFIILHIVVKIFSYENEKVKALVKVSVCVCVSRGCCNYKCILPACVSNIIHCL